MPDSTQHATPHGSLPTTKSKCSLAFHVPRLKPKQTHLEWVGETCSRQTECPCKCAWVASGTQAGVGGHTPYWCACPSVTKSQMIELFLGQEVLKSRTLTWINCKMKFDELYFSLSFQTSVQFLNKYSSFFFLFFFWTLKTNIWKLWKHHCKCWKKLCYVS